MEIIHKNLLQQSDIENNIVKDITRLAYAINIIYSNYQNLQTEFKLFHKLRENDNKYKYASTAIIVILFVVIYIKIYSKHDESPST